MKETTFANQKEKFEWAEAKWQDSEDPDHPPKVHPTNWMLSEKWFTTSQGCHKNKKTTLAEAMDRSASCLPSGLAMLGMEPENTNKQKTKTPEERHKMALSKLSAAVGRLGKAIGGAEARLPALKRLSSAGSYQKLKAGLQACRENKDESLDKIEDWKVMATTEFEIEMNITEMGKEQAMVLECLQSLQEAFKTDKAIKDEQHGQQQHQEAPEPDLDVAMGQGATS